MFDMNNSSDPFPFSKCLHIHDLGASQAICPWNIGDPRAEPHLRCIKGNLPHFRKILNSWIDFSKFQVFSHHFYLMKTNINRET